MPGRSSGNQLRSFGSVTGKENDSELSCLGTVGAKAGGTCNLAFGPLDASVIGQTIW